MIAAIDTSALLELIWAAPLAVLTVTVAWGLVVRGTTRGLEARREGHSTTAVLNAFLAGLGAAMFMAALVFGLIVMTTK